MLSFKPVMLPPVNENLFSAFQEVDGPFLLSRERPSDFKCFMKNADWTIIEIARYVDFIQKNINKMEGKAHKQLWSVYEEMGKLIKTRNFRQVKSYHQKMVESYNTIPEIVEFHLRNYPQLVAHLQKERESLNMNKMMSSSEKEVGTKTLISTTD